MTEQELLQQIPQSKGDEKRKLLLQLCDFRSQAVDAFWKSRLHLPLTQYLPYLCYSRSDAVANYAAEQLEHAVMQMLLPENQYHAELSEEVWTALNLSVFKESPQILAVLDKIGQHSEALHQMTLDMQALQKSTTLPPFLRQTANLAAAHSCESNFIRLLNDLLICTYVRSEGELGQSLTELAVKYPEAFGYVGFFVEFVEDSATAFELYGAPEFLEQVLSVFDGLEYHDGVSVQYTPVWFYGSKSHIWNKKYVLPTIDLRWISFLSSVHACADEQQRQQISTLLFQFTDLPEPYKMQLQRYFFQAALEDTSECNLVGCMRCGGYERANELIQGICEKISMGKNNYHALFTVFELLDLKKAEKLRLLSEARDFIESVSDRESWYAQRNHFLHTVKVYRLNGLHHA